MFINQIVSPVHWVLEARMVGVQVSSINKDLDNAVNFCKKNKMRIKNLLAGVKISNCFWKRHTVAKIDAH